MGRWVAVLGAPVVLLVLLAAAGCGGGSTTANEPEPTVTVSSAAPSESPTEPADLPPKPQPPRHVKSNAGAKAFGSFVVETIWYAASTHDTDAVFALDHDASCSSCAELDQKMDRKTWQVPVDESEPPATVTKVFATYSKGPVRVVGVLFDNPRHKEVRADGKVVDHLPARQRQYIDVGLTWRHGEWDLNDYKYAEG
jgi:hypothetical protein